MRKKISEGDQDFDTRSIDDMVLSIEADMIMDGELYSAEDDLAGTQAAMAAREIRRSKA